MVNIEKLGLSKYKLSMITVIPERLEKVFDFFCRAENLNDITPKWLDFKFVTPPPKEMKAGTLIEYSLKIRFVRIRWLTEITVWEPPYRFIDTQLKGPYKMWVHEHKFEADGENTKMTDTVLYELPFGPIGEIAHILFVKRDVIEIFTYRYHRIREIFGVKEG